MSTTNDEKNGNFTMVPHVVLESLYGPVGLGNSEARMAIYCFLLRDIYGYHRPGHMTKISTRNLAQRIGRDENLVSRILKELEYQRRILRRGKTIMINEDVEEYRSLPKGYRTRSKRGDLKTKKSIQTDRLLKDEEGESGGAKQKIYPNRHTKSIQTDIQNLSKQANSNGANPSPPTANGDPKDNIYKDNLKDKKSFLPSVKNLGQGSFSTPSPNEEEDPESIQSILGRLEFKFKKGGELGATE